MEGSNGNFFAAYVLPNQEGLFGIYPVTLQSAHHTGYIIVFQNVKSC